MRILVLNSGSSSIKFSLYDSEDAVATPDLIFDGQLSGIGGTSAHLHLQHADSSGPPEDLTVQANKLETAIQLVMNAITKHTTSPPEAVGYRVVHPGPNLHAHQKITPEVLDELDRSATFAPLHDPEAVMLIRSGMKHLPHATHFACFDTIFHQTMPEEATTYPLPPDLRQQGIRRYGFHGLSCESIVRQMRQQHTLPKRMVIAHLGSGCSVTALLDGCSIDTTMGLTPTGGVIMGTRSGDLDPGLVLYLMRQQQGDRDKAISAVEALLNHASGMVSLSGMENDVKAMRAAANEGNAQARLALSVFTRSITKAIGAFCWLFGGLDCIVFSGGIGEHDSQTRADILQNLSGLGVILENFTQHSSSVSIQRISSDLSKVEVLVVPAEEDLMIALHVNQMVRSETPF